MEHQRTFATIAVPLFNELHKQFFYGTQFRLSAYIVSHDIWNSLFEAALSDGCGYTSESLQYFGFDSLMFKGTPILWSKDLPPKTVFPITKNLVTALKFKDESKKFSDGYPSFSYYASDPFSEVGASDQAPPSDCPTQCEVPDAGNRDAQANVAVYIL